MNGQHFTSIKMVDEKYHLFADRITDASALDRPHKFLFSAKDNLCSIDFQTRAGSKILDGYRPPFDATPIKKMRDAGGLLVGKTNMDEFGFGTMSVRTRRSGYLSIRSIPKEAVVVLLVGRPGQSVP